MIKTYENGKLVSVQLTEWEQYDLACENNRRLRQQKLKETSHHAETPRDSEEGCFPQRQDKVPKVTEAPEEGD